MKQSNPSPKTYQVMLRFSNRKHPFTGNHYYIFSIPLTDRYGSCDTEEVCLHTERWRECDFTNAIDQRNLTYKQKVMWGKRKK